MECLGAGIKPADGFARDGFVDLGLGKPATVVMRLPGMRTRNQLRLVVGFAAIVVLVVAVGVGTYLLSNDEPGLAAGVQNPPVTHGRTLLASYQAAAVYAGSTDFYFEDSNGQIIEFRVSNLPDEQTIEFPSDLLETGVVEGPPDANPELIGEEFLLIYDDQDRLVRVERA